MDLYLMHRKGIDAALIKAKQYRSLLEPEIAISICLDIFAIDENNQEALIIYILALTDSFGHSGIQKSDKVIMQAVEHLSSDYARTYYEGIFYERKARGLVAHHSMSKSFAYRLFLEAINCYGKAQSLASQDNNDAILRHNSCVRTIEGEHLEPRQDADDEHWQQEA